MPHNIENNNISLTQQVQSLLESITLPANVHGNRFRVLRAENEAAEILTRALENAQTEILNSLKL